MLDQSLKIAGGGTNPTTKNSLNCDADHEAMPRDTSPVLNFLQEETNH